MNPMQRLGALGVGVVATAALAACTSAPPPAAATVTMTTTTTVTATATVTAAPATTSPAAPLKLGQTYSTSGFDGKEPVTYVIEQYRDPVVSQYHEVPPGRHLVGLLAGFCNKTGKPSSVSWGPWTLQGPAGENFRSEGIQNGSDPVPVYPNVQLVADGQCVKGWILFAISDGVKAATATVGTDSVPPAVWALR